MDAPNPSATPTFASRTPLHVGAIGLKVRDLARLTGFYGDVLGLAVLDRGRDSATLGAGDVPLLHLEHRPDAKPDDPRTAGLYHTAFLMPTRADLARWILHVARNKVPLTGASDHAVSEAIYLDDPEGNGVEVYRDRPAEAWQWTSGDLKMTTDPLDIEDIVREVQPGAAYPGAPGGLRIGHVQACRRRRPRGNLLPRCARSRRHPPPAWCDLPVVGALPPPQRRQRVAQRRRGPARREPGRIVLAIARSRRCLRLRRGAGAPRASGCHAHADAFGCRGRRPLGDAPAHHPRVTASSFRRDQRPHALERLGGKRPGQLAGGHRAAERRRLPRPHGGEIARALPFGFGAQRRQRAGSERKFRRHVRNGPDVAHQAVDEAARRTPGHQIGEHRAVVARRSERGPVRRRNLRLRTP